MRQYADLPITSMRQYADLPIPSMRQYADPLMVGIRQYAELQGRVRGSARNCQLETMRHYTD